MKISVSALFVSSALVSWAPGAFAQNAANPPGTAPADNQLQEVVVTATRQTSTVNKVALSIQAVTQQTLDREELKQANDLTRVVPGLALTPVNAGSGSAGTSTFAIRGISATVGAATTGVYLDDVPLNKRAVNGNMQGNGTPVPPLFDLDRVEVLKGPQGTLYGGSSEGGTVRFITPGPSLTTMSGRVQAEVSHVEDGATGYNLGAAVGGPIIQDKLGFRISGLTREVPGYINLYDAYSMKLADKDANSEWDKSIHAELLWQITPQAKLLLSAFHSSEDFQGGPNAPTTVPNGMTFTTPTVCNSTIRTTPLISPTTGLPQSFSPTPIPCPAYAVAGQTVNNVHERASYTYGPFNLGRNDAVVPQVDTLLAPSKTQLDVYSASFDYDFGWSSLKSISAYLHDASMNRFASSDEPVTKQSTVGGGPGGVGAGLTGFPLFAPYEIRPYDLSLTHTHRDGISEELRLTSPADSRPFSWVTGLFFNQQNSQASFVFPGPVDQTIEDMWGIDGLARYGVPTFCNGTYCLGASDAVQTETETAIYGEGNYWVTSKLKLTAGLRVSNENFKYHQVYWGQYQSRYPDSLGSITNGVLNDVPITPKFGIEYDLAPNDLVYFTASKGFRPGGVNPVVGADYCAQGLAVLGVTAQEIPNTYKSDTVWSYEAGGKFKLMDGRMQLNGALYRIDWSGIQATVTVPVCNANFVENGQQARSQGVDLQLQYRVIPPLTVSFAGSYDDAHYIQAVAGPVPGRAGVTPSYNAGDPLPVPPWQVSTSAEYNLEVIGRPSYVRVDYQWQSYYDQGPSFGTASYNPYTRIVPSYDSLTIRGGMSFGHYSVDLYANNPLNSSEMFGNAGNGRTTCVVASGPSCSTFSTYNPFVQQQYIRPREIGIQMNARF